MSKTDPGVAIIGAGALGSCTARELASDHDVTLIFDVARKSRRSRRVRKSQLEAALVQILLLGGLTLSALVLTLDRLKKVSEWKRILAVPLGILGVGIFLNVHNTNLPILFIVLGVGNFLDVILSRFDGFR